MNGFWRTRWAAIGAAIAVTMGAGGVSLTHAEISSGDKPVFVAITPCRLIDTRPATQVGPKSTPLGPNETISLQITGSTGQCSGIPADATGAAMNMTAILPTAQSFLTVYPSDAVRPNTSNLNWAAGDPPTPNKVDVKLGPDGAIKVFNSVGTVHLAADLVGYYVDHNHNDLYYTKTQTEALVAASPTPWSTLPSGTTVSGPIRWDEESSVTSGDYRIYIPFPAIAPALPNNANFAPDGSPATVDDDPQCAGTAEAPTAPAGKVCIYLVNTSLTTNMTGDVFSGLLNRGFEIRWNVTGTGDMFVYGSWAYTAP